MKYIQGFLIAVTVLAVISFLTGFFIYSKDNTLAFKFITASGGLFGFAIISSIVLFWIQNRKHLE